jgi:2-(1,2-epoxy-1,2-dihydrophenyl)acetyl-CoA isomerase
MTGVEVDRPNSNVCRIRINRPSARNAIDADVRAGLAASLADAQADEAVRSVMIGGAHWMFCGGGDLPTMLGMTPDEARARMREGATIAKSLWRFPKPVTVAVERFAIGAAAGIAMLADHIVIGEAAVFGFPFLKLGLVPDWGLTMTLAWRAGPSAAARLLRQAAAVGAIEAVSLGLADDIAPDGDVAARALEVATNLARLPPLAFSRMKARLRGADIAVALEDEVEAQTACLTGAEFHEGYNAFRAKRPPRFA